MTYTFIRAGGNRKTGPIPQTYSARSTCPPSCSHYGADCYGEDYFTRMQWDKVPARGISIDALAAQIASLPPRTLWRMNVAGDLPGAGEAIDAFALGQIVKANTGRRGFTYTHKHSAQAIKWARHATDWGFVVNLSADDAGHAEAFIYARRPEDCRLRSPNARGIYLRKLRQLGCMVRPCRS